MLGQDVAALTKHADYRDDDRDDDPAVSSNAAGDPSEAVVADPDAEQFEEPADGSDNADADETAYGIAAE